MTQDKKPLENKILDWLNSQGYPLEMKVASSLHETDLLVRQSYYYPDPETQIPREIDIFTTKTDELGLAEINLMIECKSSTKPWLLFTSELTLANYNRLFAFGILSDAAIKVLADSNKHKDVFSLPWFKKKGRAAYAMTQAFTSGTDLPYKASLNALKAAVSHRLQVENDKYRSSIFHFIFPVIVVEGDLFECYLNEKNNLEINKTDQCFFHFPTLVAGDIGTCIRVVSSKDLDAFCNEASELSSKLLDLLKDDIEKEWNHITKQRTRMHDSDGDLGS